MLSHNLPLLVLSILIIINLTTSTRNNEVEMIMEWKQLEFGFPSYTERDKAIANGNFVSGHGIPIDVDVHYNKGQARMFTTVPHFANGIPFSLATVSQFRHSPHAKGPLLQAYPSYDWHSSHGNNCAGITSAFRTAINQCDQMWVIDSGVMEGITRCPPKLLLFDLQTDRLIHQYTFENGVFTPNASLLITPLVVTNDPPPKGQCRQTMVYIADVSFHGLVIYDYQKNTAWRAENKYMYPDPDYGTHTVAGESFDLMDGIFGLSTDKNMLYFHPLASNREYAVSLSVLNDQSTWEDHSEALPNEFRAVGTRNSECGAEVIDSRNNLYCVHLNPIKFISWNVNTPYKAKNLREIPINPKLLEFVSGMKVVRNSAGKEEIWMMSNRFQKLAAGTQSADEINFRILKYVIDDLQNTIDVGAPSNKDLHNKLVFS